MAGSVRPNVLRVLGSRQGRTPSADAPLPALATCGIHGGWSTIRSLFYFWRGIVETCPPAEKIKQGGSMPHHIAHECIGQTKGEYQNLALARPKCIF